MSNRSKGSNDYTVDFYWRNGTNYLMLSYESTISVLEMNELGVADLHIQQLVTLTFLVRKALHFIDIFNINRGQYESN